MEGNGVNLLRRFEDLYLGWVQRGIEKGRRGYGMTSPKDGMLPAAFIALMVFVLIVTLNTSVLPITVLLDTLATWWLITLFLITLKDGLFNEKKGVK